MMSDKKDKEEQETVREMVQEVAATVAKADLGKVVEKAVEEKKQELVQQAQQASQVQQGPPVVAQLVVTKYQVGNQTVPDVKMAGLWTCGDFLDLSVYFQQLSRNQVVGKVVPEGEKKE